MSPLWDHRAQHLVMYGIDLVLLLLLLTFHDTLLSYSLTLIRTITAPGIPVRRNTQLEAGLHLSDLDEEGNNFSKVKSMSDITATCRLISL